MAVLDGEDVYVPLRKRRVQKLESAGCRSCAGGRLVRTELRDLSGNTRLETG